MKRRTPKTVQRVQELLKGINVGMLTTRGGSKLVGDYGGVWKVAPILGGMFLIAALATVALPGTNSFISEFMVLIGTFSRHPAWAVVARIAPTADSTSLQ